MREARAERYGADDADVVVVAFGTAARVARTAVQELCARGLRAGLVRPITLSPFPEEAIRDATARAGDILTVELNTGQMREDVERAVAGRARVRFLGRQGGVVPSPDEIIAAIEHPGAG